MPPSPRVFTGPALCTSLTLATVHHYYSIYLFQARREEDRQHAERKKELRKELQQLRQQIMELIEENSTLPDLEKLERYEFNLDEEERQRLIALGEQSVKQVRKQF
jgi:TolA-binding protein